MSENKKQLPGDDKADLRWTDETIPFSVRFADTYYSKAGGRAETAYVFIAGNDLPARWPSMRACTIAELGFGTGLNFLETARRWRLSAPPGATLRYVSFERFPLPREAMRKALSRWPELAGLSPALVENWHMQDRVLTIRFSPDVELTVILDDANTALPGFALVADAWYLDGFAPARNPDLWSAELMAEIYAHCVPGGTFATYSAAGWVRRNLQAAGFTVARRPGFAGKREMLVGRRPE